MKHNKRHYICWLKFWSAGAIFERETAPNMRDEKDSHQWGFKTICGEIFWPQWQGTTNKADVTCKKCLRILEKQPGNKQPKLTREKAGELL